MIFYAPTSPISLALVICFILALTEEAHSLTFTATTRRGFAIGQHHASGRNTKYRRCVHLDMSATAEDDSVTILSAEAKALQEKAEKLRAEIAALTDSKEEAQEAQRQELQAELDQQEAYMQHYSGEVPILKPDGSVVLERVQFPPLIKSNSEDDDNTEGSTTDFASDILVCEARLPLGMILGQETESNAPAMVVVDEILEDSNGALAGIQEGDVLRACTSCTVEMEQPTWQLLVGGIGRPKTVRFMFGTDDEPLEAVLEALGANRMDPEERPVVLVVERPNSRSDE